MRAARRIRVEDSSQVAESRRAAASMAASSGLGETDVGKVSIVATELATNLLKHARGGEMILTCPPNGCEGIEILALDKGRGMDSVRRCMEDGYSTAGSPGSGLGAVGRLSAYLEIYSAPQRGTAALTGFRTAPASAPMTMAVGGVSIPVQGEEVCGDSWAEHETGAGVSILVADGLGHGPGASAAAEKAVEIFNRNPGLMPKEMVEAIHIGLHNTRGASVGVARIDTSRDEMRFSGVGNISGVIVSQEGSQHSVISHNGTAGMQAALRTVQEFTYPFPPGALAIFHSDGLATHWKLASYPGLARCHPTLVSAVLYRDYTRGRDDVTVVTARRQAP
jgi:anti-sigma regulatory factor (Ser/Thr protein kinase)